MGLLGQPRARPKIEPFLPIIREILTADRQAPRKQRHTAKRIWQRLRTEHGFDGKWKLNQKGELFDMRDAPFNEILVAADTANADATSARQRLQAALDTLTRPAAFETMATAPADMHNRRILKRKSEGIDVPLHLKLESLAAWVSIEPKWRRFDE